MEKQITDEEDKLKRQARRRLIGAVALTTAIVVVLPMVLENEPKPVGQDIELRIPDKDKVGTFAPRIDLQATSAPAASSPSATLPEAASAPVIVSQPVAQEAVVPAPVNQSATIPGKTLVTGPEHKPDQVRPNHDKKAGETHSEQGQAVPKTGLALQLGAFSNADTAHSWQKNLIQQGFKAYTEKVGDKVRVRIGPYSSREAANKARHKLEDKGLHSNIVDLD